MKPGISRVMAMLFAAVVASVATADCSASRSAAQADSQSTAARPGDQTTSAGEPPKQERPTQERATQQPANRTQESASEEPASQGRATQTPSTQDAGQQAAEQKVRARATRLRGEMGSSWAVTLPNGTSDVWTVSGVNEMGVTLVKDRAGHTMSVIVGDSGAVTMIGDDCLLQGKMEGTRISGTSAAAACALGTGNWSATIHK